MDKRHGLSSRLRVWRHQLWFNTFLRWSLGLVLLWRAALEILNQAISQSGSSFLVNMQTWSNWDGHWYLSINQYGYGVAAPVERQANVAFFPGFPEAVNAIGIVAPLQHLYIGLLLNIGLTAAVIYLLMKLAYVLAGQYGDLKERSKCVIAVLSGAALLAFPSSFFLAAYYAEALLVLGFVGAVYFAITRRLWWAVPFMIMASSSKVTGTVVVATVGLIVLEQWLHDRNRNLLTLIKQWLITSLGTMGLVAYSAYLGIAHHSPLLFYHIEEVWGRNTSGFFVTSLIRGYYAHFFDQARFGGLYYHVLNMFWMVLPFVVLSVGLLIVRCYKTVWPLVLGAAIVLLPLSTGLMEGLSRYCLALAPIVPFVFIWLHKKVRPLLLVVLLVISFAAMLGFAYGFLNGRYFAG